LIDIHATVIVEYKGSQSAVVGGYCHSTHLAGAAHLGYHFFGLNVDDSNALVTALENQVFMLELHKR